jgi:hypothetical protein
MNIIKSSNWVPKLSAILIGWNVAIFCIILVAALLGILIGQFVNQITNPVLMGVILLVSVITGVVIGISFSKKSYSWVKRLNKTTAFVVFVLLATITVLSLPAPFTYVVG